MNKLIQKLYYKSCQEELMVLKPGNHSIHSGIIGMNNKRFEFAAKVSGEIFINKKFTPHMIASEKSSSQLIILG